MLGGRRAIDSAYTVSALSKKCNGSDVRHAIPAFHCSVIDWFLVCFSSSFTIVMVLDIDMFRVEKGGLPDEVRKNQKKRFKDVSLVDQVIEKDAAWRKCKFMEFG